MAPDKMDLTELTEEAIEQAGTANLRGWADAAQLSDWNVRVSIATFTLDHAAVSNMGVLSGIEKLTHVLLAAYRDRGARVKKSYGDSMEVQVYAEDISLRHALKREREVQVQAKEAAETTES